MYTFRPSGIPTGQYQLEELTMPLSKRAFAEFMGTFWLVFGGCGSAVLAAAFPGLGIGFAGVALAFGLTVLTMAYAIGHISGCHLNPAVSVGLVVGKRFPVSELPMYVIAQVLGAVAGSGILYLIASGKEGFSLAGGFAANGYGAHSPGGYALGAAMAAEVVLTFMFLMIILGATDRRAPQRICAHPNRPWPDTDPLDRDPRDESICKPRAKHRSRRFCRRLGARAI